VSVEDGWEAPSFVKRILKMASSDSSGDDSLYPIAVLIDELRNEDVQVYPYENQNSQKCHNSLDFPW
jgi:hypothetical protein